MTSRFFRREIAWEDFQQDLDLRPPPGIDPPEGQFNIAPPDWVPVIRPPRRGEGLELALMRWGLVPMWWMKPLSEKNWSSHSARSEEIDESASFRAAYRYRRCLIPASGWYVWKTRRGTRQPAAASLVTRPWFAFAAIWECWGHDGTEIDTVAILSTEANSLIKPYSSRMPVILDPRDFSRWLEPGQKTLTRMLQPADEGEMQIWPVDQRVMDIRNQGPELCEPLDAPR